MTETCSRSFCWLSTAGIFILVGAVQFTAGVVLLKSNYVYLLAGPDFWTAAGNIVTGSVLGIAASVWKKPRKRLYSRHVARENVVLALLVSAVILNATTSAILIMGEGNAILTIDIEISLEKDYQLGNEILRIAYATSVVCPVVCLVVAAMAVTEGCCSSRSKTSLSTPHKQQKRRSLLKVTPKRYDWVFDPEQDLSGYSKPKKVQSTASSPSSSGCDDAMGTSSIELSSSVPKYPAQSTPTVEDLNNSLARMHHSRISSVRHPEDSLDYSLSSPSLAGEVVAIQIRNESGTPEDAIPVEQPRTGTSILQRAQGDSSVDSAPSRVRLLIPKDAATRLKRTKFSSFRATEQFSPKKKNHQRCKSPIMESIVEVPSSEDVSNLLLSPSVTSGYGSSPEVTMNTSKEATSVQTAAKQVVSSGEMVTPRKASTETIPKELYGKIRSRSLPVPMEIFDVYSLVGLSHLELIATQHRNHAVFRYLQRKASGN